jgi:primosomal protein N' (replication factor Y)
MIVEIIPARRMPLALPFLDYLVSAEDEAKIQIGQLVKIPFRNSEEFGVIFNIKKNNDNNQLKLKSITEVVFTKPILAKAQLDFLKDISDFYHASLGFLLKNNLPPLQKRKLKKLITDDDNFTPKKLQREKPELIVYKTQEEKNEIILKNIDRASGQTLFLVPEVTSLEKIKTILPAESLDKAVFITSDLSPKEIFTTWIEIWSGIKKIIIGTRRALFLPWFNLTSIIIEDEGNPNYKSWDMAPRFHTRDAALFLSKSHGAKLTMLSHSPSVETYFFAQKKVYDAKNLEVKPFVKPIQLVDMRGERRIKNFSLLSQDLFEEFKNIKSGDIFFFLNRRGTVSYVACRDCGDVLKCPKCRLSLTYYHKTLHLVCNYCKHSEPIPLSCKKCHGTDVNMFGAGTQLAEDLIKKIMAEKKDYTIVRVDSDEKDLSKLDTPGNKIIIGTQLAWSRVDWAKIKLFAFLDADSSLFIPEYKIAENLWQQLRDMQFNLSAKAKIIVQTNHPEHLVFTDLFNPESFYSNQLDERRMLGYPPFKFLLKLVTGHHKEDMMQLETRKAMAKLANLTKNRTDITILEPIKTSPYYHDGQYWQVILAKIKYDNYKKNTNLILSQLSDNWKVDPNPNSILSFS